jgi:hypothetical protein
MKGKSLTMGLASLPSLADAGYYRRPLAGGDDYPHKLVGSLINAILVRDLYRSICSTPKKPAIAPVKAFDSHD